MEMWKVAVRALALISVITGILYPLSLVFITNIWMVENAKGSLIHKGGKLIGSALIGQQFSAFHYFWPRPSASYYDPLHAEGSQLGPTSQALKEAVVRRREHLETTHVGKGEVPADLLYASASGLDPDITPDAARFQIDRIAKARHWDGDTRKKLDLLVEEAIEMDLWDLFAIPRINVLRLNLSLDELEPHE